MDSWMYSGLRTRSAQVRDRPMAGSSILKYSMYPVSIHIYISKHAQRTHMRFLYTAFFLI